MNRSYRSEWGLYVYLSWPPWVVSWGVSGHLERLDKVEEFGSFNLTFPYADIDCVHKSNR